ncbi:hypothetical protein ACWIE7_02955 [Dietzia sp. NPDC055343]
MSATQVTRPGTGRIDARERRVRPGVDEDYDDDGVRPLPSTEPSPGARSGRPVGGRPRRPRPAPERGVPVPARRSAHALVVMALEVVDRKRSPNNMRGAFPEHLVEMLRTLARTGVPGRQLGPARIHRLHIHPAGVDPAPAGDGGTGAGHTADAGSGAGGEADPRSTDYEVCATYARGPRLFAVAARIRVTPTGASCVALRMV